MRTPRQTSRWTTALLAAAALGAPPAGAQPAPLAPIGASSLPVPAAALAPTDSTALASVASPAAPLLSTRARWVLGAVAVGGLALLPVDRPIAQELREAHVQRMDGVRGTADAFNLLGGPGLAMLGVGSYAVGRAAGSPALTTLGVHATAAVVAATAVAGVVKGVAGRQRPYVNAGDPDLFGAGRGFSRSSRTSFPSGHTTAAFALAAAATEETRQLWPDHARLVGSLAYGTAGAVGIARAYDGKHWSSDVMIGAGLGTLTGLVTSHYLWRHPHNRLDRWLSGAAVTPSPGGGGLALAIRMR